MSKCKELLNKLNEKMLSTKDRDWFVTQDKYKTEITNWGIYLIIKKTKNKLGPFDAQVIYPLLVTNVKQEKGYNND